MAVRKRNLERLGLLALAAALFGIDRWSKQAVADGLELYGSHAVIPGFFNLVHTRNTGIAFSLFADAGPFVKEWLLPVLSGAAVLFVVVLLWRSDPQARVLNLSLSLILAGAAGNLYDRLLFGYVTDFLDLYVGSRHWPAFNVADSCITVGAVMLLLDSVIRPQDASERARKRMEAESA